MRIQTYPLINKTFCIGAWNQALAGHTVKLYQSKGVTYVRVIIRR